MMGTKKFSQLPAATAINPADELVGLQSGVNKRFAASLLPAGGMAPRDIVQLIHDTDIGEDCDDVGGFAVMHRLADLGECEILACGYVGTHTYGPQCISALNTFYGRVDIPIGTGPSSYTGTDYYGTVLAGQQNDIDDDTAVEVAYRLYRRVLAAAKDNSVTLMFSGQMTNLQALYNSVADEYSPLNGEDLLLLKAAKLVLLAGDYPSGSEHDLTSDPAAAQVVNQLHPDLSVIWSGYDVGDDVLTVSNQPSYSPVRKSYDAFFSSYPAVSRPSWGALCCIYAVRGLAFGGDTYFTQSALGANAVDAGGNNTFTADGSKQQRYLNRSLSAATFVSRVQALQDALPTAAASSIHYGAAGLEFPVGTAIGGGGGGSTPVEYTTSIDLTLDASHAWPNTLRVTGGVSRTITVPVGVFSSGPGPKVIAWGASVTLAGAVGRNLRLGGSVGTIGNRTLANATVADIYIVDNNEAIVSGQGVT